MIREPPLLMHLLFESPWPVVGVLVVVALGLGIAGSRRANGRLQLAGLVTLVLAGGVWLLAWVVTTDREAVLGQTRRLVQATAPLDLAAVRSLVDAEAVVTGPGGGVWYDWSDAQRLLVRTLERWPVQEQTIRGLAGEVEGDTARTAIDLRTTLADAGLPLPSTWLITWRRGPADDWRATEIRWLTLRGTEPQKGSW